MKNLIAKFKDFYSLRNERNLYKIDGAVPFWQALALGFEHVLVMLLANMTPVIIVFWQFNNSALTINAIQAGLLIAGLSTILELFPISFLGSGLPVVGGVSFSFMGALALVGSNFDYGTMMGSLLIGGVFLVIIGFLGKYLRKIIKPIVRGIVILSVGLGLIEEGIKQFLSVNTVVKLSSTGVYDFSLAWPFIIIAVVSLVSGLIYSSLVKGIWKNISVTIGLVSGYIVSLILNVLLPDIRILDFSAFHFSTFTDFIDIPNVLNFAALKFNPKAIAFVCLIYLIASIEGIGDLDDVNEFYYHKPAEDREIVGGLVTDGIFSLAAVCLGSLPMTTSSQNVAYVRKTGIVNKWTILIGAVLLIIMGLMPPIAEFLESIPEAVLGGTMMLCYLSILMIGFQMLVKAGFNAKNTTIISVSVGLGYGITLLGDEFFNAVTFGSTDSIAYIILKNPEAMMFLISFALSYIIPDSFNNRPGIDEVKEETFIEEEKQPVKGSDSKIKENDARQ